MKTCKKFLCLIFLMTLVASCGGGSSSSSPTDSLPSCTTYTPFSTPPIAEGNYENIAPLGNLNPTGHTFPTNHIYIYVNRVDGTPIPTNVVSPADITVLSVSSTEHLSESPVYTDYTLYFSTCKEIWAVFGHVQSLEASILEKIGEFDPSRCTTYSTGGKTFKQCTKTTNFTISDGTLIGTAGREGQYALDFTLFDTRTGPLAFANPDRIAPASGNFNDLHVVCPVDYFTDEAATQMRRYFGSASEWRTIEPVCGDVMQDIAGTAQGKWFNTNEPNSPEDPHLALVHDNVDPRLAAFSVGTSITAIADSVMKFTPNSSGLVNIDFGDVGPDGKIYCYENMTDAPENTIVILQLTDNETLKIEAQSAASCGSGPWSFTGSANTFHR